MSNTNGNAKWVIGQYEADVAKSVIDLANAGVGYIILKQFRESGKQVVVAAFRWIIDGPTPEHLVEMRDPFKIRDMEKKRARRSGLIDRSEPTKYNPKKMEQIRASLFSRNLPVPTQPTVPIVDITQSQRAQQE